MLSYPQDLVQFKVSVAKSEGIAVGRAATGFPLLCGTIPESSFKGEDGGWQQRDAIAVGVRA